MQRRTALKQLGLLAGAVVLLPHCAGKETPRQATLTLNNISISGNQEDAMAALTDALIPETELPGARELNVQHFVWRMVDDCTEKADQQNFLAGLDQVREIAKQKFGQPLELCNRTDLQSLLIDINTQNVNAEGGNNNIPAFYKIFRSYAIQGFTGAEPIMTNVFGYNMIPGRFTGIVEINASSDLKTILG